MAVRGVSNPVLNAASFDFLALSRSPEVKEASKKALEFYGCGSCGPRGFYGTIDQHFLLEKAVAEFMGTQVCNAASTAVLCGSHASNFL